MINDKHCTDLIVDITESELKDILKDEYVEVDILEDLEDNIKKVRFKSGVSYIKHQSGEVFII